MLQIGVLHQIVERRILVETLGALPGAESIIEAPGIIWRELDRHALDLAKWMPSWITNVTLVLGSRRSQLLA